MTTKQQTIKKSISITGAGLHTGKNVTLTIMPAPENSGISFRRIDLEGQPEIKADADYVTDTSRGTTLEKDGAKVTTIEHCLAALTGLGIDNAMIELDCIETPILDGSSKIYIERIEEAGIQEQEAEKDFFELDQVLTYTDPENKIELLAIPSDEFRLSVMIDYNTKVLGTQHASLDKLDDFKEEIARSRTFVFLHELEYLINNNLVKGGDLNNAIVFVNRLIEQEELDKLADFFGRPRMQVLKEGMLNNIELNYPNEPARHKLLDIIGDLTLIGKPIKAHIIAKRPGHHANTEFAKIIKHHIKKIHNTAKGPNIDLNAKPVYDINQIKNLLPHRPPFLLVDKIMKVTPKNIIGVKNITMNENFFVGHFPNEPVMPGVLLIEAMAQTGGILVLSNIEDPENYLTYFLKVDNAKFRQKVVPGDTVIFDLELVSPIRRGLCHMRGTAWVGNKIVTEAEMMAQVVKVK